MSGNPLSDVPPQLFVKGRVFKLELLQAFEGRPAVVMSLSRRDSMVVTSAERDPFKIFEVDLYELMDKEYELFPYHPLPRIVRHCVNFVFTHGLLLEGVFRVAGQSTQMIALRDQAHLSPAG